MGKTLYLSVPFTWLMAEANDIASQYKGEVRIGGPGTMKPTVCEEVEPLLFHNPLATFTSRGCPNKCKFCAVPRLEGEFRELDSWRPAPIICDNNLLASTQRHFDKVIDSLKRFDYCDFNQGLDARLLKSHHASRLGELKNPHIRFAFDHISMELTTWKAVELVRQNGLKNISVYVLIGFNDTPDEATYKLETVRSWGIWPNPMRYQPLDASKKNQYVGDGWTEEELRKMVKYYSRLRWYEHIPYNEFKYREIDYRQAALI